MPVTKPFGLASRELVNATRADRDRAVDVARLAALVVVMFGHCALLLATIDSSGVRIGNLLGELPALQPVTWLVQVMPLFFFAGGAAGAYGWRVGTPWGIWLFTRAQRLCRPAFWYLAVWVAALAVAGMTLGPESAAALGRECVALLWFLGVYLVVLASVPTLTRLRTGRGVAAVVVSLLACAAVVDGIRLAVGTAESGVVNFLIVWLIPVAFGVAYARRLIGMRAALAAAVAAFTGQVLLAGHGPYDVSLVVTGAERVSNVSPPTLLLALHCTWMSCVFVAAAGAVRRWAARPRVWGIVAMGNGGAMTLYLWHIPAIAIAAFGLHALGFDAYNVHAPGFWSLLALRAVVFAVVMAVAFRLLTPLEHRSLPWWDGSVSVSGAGRVRSLLAGALICVAGVALVLLAKNGLSGFAGFAALGCFLVATATARLAAARQSPSDQASLGPNVPRALDVP
ncbi:acetyltransferase [Mycobacterium intermedium]|uniref:Acetyltransferase n=1 Tax=Mycobacterium intermedium TaxID=28445 RepID=A0A1E3SKC2_MYCIE|nr:acyltransferase family protein [Mycobacterium intermedium]MCV6967210.1 acyltransferase family protein [Mycobacterium intermedium]ODR02083.1 acetyltransferase [Mycobacterium intermedium]OPE45557.1 acetyltransferase [Mycobacterium intermedium]ORB09038.1 acetyltransferase [Mycobacterium intermedium]